jgi:hypothetical protein
MIRPAPWQGHAFGHALICASALALFASACGGEDELPPDNKGARIISFKAEPTKIKSGEAALLSWETVGASGVNIEPTVGLQPAMGTAEVRPFATTTYTLTIREGDDVISSAVTVEVVGGPPRIDAFTATPRTIRLGETSTLEWATTNTTHVLIEPDVGMQSPTGSFQVSPEVTTAYRLTAVGESGTANTELTVVVASGNQPFIQRFIATPSTIQAGQSATLTWETVNADSVTIDNGVGQQPASGSFQVTPTQTTIYNLTAVGPGGTAALPVTVTVQASGEPRVIRFDATPSTIPVGGTSTLVWETDSAVSVSIDNGVGAQAAKGSVTVTPQQTTTYTLTAIGATSQVTDTVVVTVAAANAPVVLTFAAQPQAVQAGGSTTLSWTTQNATSVDIDNGAGTSLPANGSVQVTPTQTTTYTLTATGPAGQATAQAVVTVTAAPPVVVGFSAQPPSITAGQTATLSWETANATAVDIDNGVGTGLPATGSAQVTPAATTQYLMTVSGPGGQTTAQVTVTVGAVGAPTIVSFTATPQQVSPGTSIALEWETQNATTVTIDNGIGAQAVTGQVQISPSVSTTYTLTAEGPGGTTTAQVSVTVASSNGDQCADPFLITGSGTFSGNTQTAVDDYSPGPGGCTGFSASGPDVVYRVPLQTGDRLQASLTPTPTAWDASLYLVNSCSNVAQGCVAGQDNGNPEEVDYTAATAGDFFLIVDGFSSAGGAYELTVTLNPAPVPNDQCGGAIDASSGGVFTGDTRNATEDYSPGTGGCTGFPATAKDVTYVVNLQAGERLQASLDAPWDSALYVVTDCSDPAQSCLDGEDNGNPEEIDVVAPSAGPYFLVVDGYRNATGSFSLSVSISPPVVGGETCSTAVAVPAGGGSFQSTTDGFNNDYAPPQSCFGAESAGPDLVYSISAAAGDVVEVLGEFDAALDGSVYLLNDCADLATGCLGGSDTGSAGEAEGFRFVPQQAGTYYVVVDAAVSTTAGGHDLTIAQYTGDTCGDAAPLLFQGQTEWFTTEGQNNDYSPDPGAGGCTGFSASGADRAYVIYLFAGEQLQVDAQALSAWDPSIYLVSDCSNIGSSCVQGSDHPEAGGAESLSAVVQQAGAYYLVLDGFFGDEGAGNVTTNIVKGDTCADAYRVPASGGTFMGTTSGYAADVGKTDRTGSCTNWEQVGADAIYQLTLEPGQTLDASLQSSWDGSLYLVSDCAQSATTCVTGQDNGSPEDITFTNSGAAAQSYHLVVDSWRTGSSYEGNYTLTIDIQ